MRDCYKIIVNPKNGVYESIFGKNGQNILKNYINQLYGGGISDNIDNEEQYNNEESSGESHIGSDEEPVLNLADAIANRVHFDDIASEWDPQCNKLNKQQCLEENIIEYCKWRGESKQCVAHEADDLEDEYYDRLEEEQYSDEESNEESEENSEESDEEIGEESNEESDEDDISLEYNLEEFNKLLQESRLSGFSREGLASLKTVLRGRDVECTKGTLDVNKCNKPTKSEHWEYPCFIEQNNECCDEDNTVCVKTDQF